MKTDKPAEKPQEVTVNVNVTTTSEGTTAKADGESTPAKPSAEGAGTTGDGGNVDDASAGPPMTDDESNYEVVQPPVGATVPYLPEEADEKKIGGKKYFIYEGTYYRPFSSDGDTVYMVVENPKDQKTDKKDS